MDTNIVIVDDTPDNVRLLMGTLSERGYKIRPVLDGVFALATIRADPPDLILLDVVMPGLDGYQVCEALHADARLREIPIIFISALNGLFDKVKAFAVGAVDYIAKPFQAAEVLARVETHLALRQLQKNLQAEIARRAASEEALRQRNQELQAANASKDKFFSIIAHDLRNPVNTFYQLCEIVAENIDHYSPEEMKRMAILQRNSANQLVALLENLLTWANSQQNLIEFQPQRLDLRALISRNIAILALNAQKKGITLRNSCTETVAVTADSQMVNTVMLNLLSNALKFTPAQGAIDVSVTPNGREVEIAVSDTGIGIAEKNLPQLFQIDSTYKRRGTANESGTGLGLLLCHEFVARHGGKLSVASAVGQGTTFRFTLPKADADALPSCQAP